MPGVVECVATPLTPFTRVNGAVVARSAPAAAPVKLSAVAEGMARRNGSRRCPTSCALGWERAAGRPHRCRRRCVRGPAANGVREQRTRMVSWCGARGV